MSPSRESTPAKLREMRAATAGLGFWTPPKAIASSLDGAGAVERGADVVVLGLVVHLIIAVACALIFAAATDRKAGRPLALRLGITHALWRAWAAGHVVYGIGIALAPWLRRRIHSRQEVGKSAGEARRQGSAGPPVRPSAPLTVRARHSSAGG